MKICALFDSCIMMGQDLRCNAVNSVDVLDLDTIRPPILHTLRSSDIEFYSGMINHKGPLACWRRRKIGPQPPLQIA